MELNIPQDMPAYAMFALFVIAVVALYAIIIVYSGERKRRSRVIRSLFLEKDDESKKDSLTPLGRFCSDFLTICGVSIEKKRKEKYGELGKAGVYTEDAVAKFLFFRFVIQPFIMFTGVVMMLVMIMGSSGAMGLVDLAKLVGGGIVAYIGIAGHNVALDKLATLRQQKLMLEFPDAVDLLLICVESGMGLDAALSRVTHELQHTHVCVTAELERTRVELGVLGDRVEALQNLAERTDIQSYRSLVSALVQSEKYGTNLASTLRTLSKEYRDQRLLKAEEKAARVSALLTLPVVVGVFFPVMALIMSPPIISMMSGGMFR